MQSHDLSRILVALLALLSTGLTAHVVFAQVATSSSFTTRNSTVNTVGGGGTSTSFSEQQSGDQVGGGESTSTDFQLDSGFMYYDTYTPKQQNWRWYDDETDETPTVPLAGENVAPSSIADGNIIKLRVSVAEVAGIGASDLKFKLQYATSSDFSGGAHDVVEISNCVAGSVWCYANGAGVDNAIITTKVLSDADACSGSVGTGCGTHNESGTSTSTLVQKKNTVTEYEFTIQESSSTPNTVYFFRLVNTTGSSTVPLNTGANYPSLSAAGATLTFSIDGVPASTLTSGTTTTINTTSTDVPFGSLLSSGSAIGAQQLTVTTNASQGYEIFSYTTQGFVGAGTAQIPPVTGTNSNPLGWSTGCSSSATGCYGYHTGEAVLFGGSTRFAADDTYAQFSTTSPNEVAYSAGPSAARSTNIVYKTEIHDQQIADAYSTNVVYIVVPTF